MNAISVKDVMERVLVATIACGMLLANFMPAVSGSEMPATSGNAVSSLELKDTYCSKPEDAVGGDPLEIHLENERDYLTINANTPTMAPKGENGQCNWDTPIDSSEITVTSRWFFEGEEVKEKTSSKTTCHRNCARINEQNDLVLTKLEEGSIFNVDHLVGVTGLKKVTDLGKDKSCISSKFRIVRDGFTTKDT